MKRMATKKLFMCNLCEYSFGNIKELLSHLSTLHEGNEEKETDNDQLLRKRKKQMMIQKLNHQVFHQRKK